VTPNQRNLVQGSWLQIKENSKPLECLFYQKLAELNPNLKVIFKANLEDQGHRLVTMIDHTVSMLDDVSGLFSAARQLSKHYPSLFKANDQDYAVVAKALLLALAQSQDEPFDAELKQAWVVVYSMLAETLRKSKNLMSAKVA